MIKDIGTIMRREFAGYFYSPIAYVIITVFLLAGMGCLFFIGRFFEQNQAGLEVFFIFHPWLYLLIVPATGMRLWSEERSNGTIELLFTLPIRLSDVILGKFLAGWLFLGIALMLSFPLIITVFYLGSPDAGVLLSGYFGSFLMAGAYLAISCFTSALTRNQVISFILSVIICFLLVLLGWGVFIDILNSIFPQWLSETISSFGFIARFDSIRKGVLSTGDIMFFVSIIFGGLAATGVILENIRKG